MHAPTVFAALLDPSRGGTFEFGPDEPFEVERTYLERTNVLQTTYRTAGGVVRVTDAFSLQHGLMLPWIEVVRRIEGLAGEVRLHWRVRPRFDWGRVAAKFERKRGALVAECGELRLGVHAWGVGEPVVGDESISGSALLRGGEGALLALCCSHREPIPIPDRDEVERRLELTPCVWRRWLESCHHGGRWVEAVVRSALALKLLAYTPTGAIAAAPTTSLPERLGGDKNYDYRYAWVRDSAFALDAMMRLGLRAQVHESFSFLLRAVAGTAPDVHPFYSLEGRSPRRAEELPLRGYRDSRPVRYGNAARAQLQLGSWGDLLETANLYVEHGNALDEATAQMLANCLDRLCLIWRDEDSGIWELDDQRHWTTSKLAVWMAFDRGLKLVERGQIPSGHAERWRAERTRVESFVEERCWSDTLGAYAAYEGSERSLDAAVLRAARMGFAEQAPQRFAATIEVVRSRLSAGGPLVYRTSDHVGQEGAFLACSFWLAEALARIGRVDEASTLMDELVALANDVGLLPEQIEPSSKAFLGNFPQALSHLALINAAGAIEDAERRTTSTR